MSKLACNTQLMDVFRNVILLKLLFILYLRLSNELGIALNLLAKLNIHGFEICHIRALLFDFKLYFLELVYHELLLFFDVLMHFALVEHVNTVLLLFNILSGLADAQLRLVFHLLTLAHLL